MRIDQDWYVTWAPPANRKQTRTRTCKINLKQHTSCGSVYLCGKRKWTQLLTVRDLLVQGFVALVPMFVELQALRQSQRHSQMVTRPGD